MTLMCTSPDFSVAILCLVVLGSAEEFDAVESFNKNVTTEGSIRTDAVEILDHNVARKGGLVRSDVVEIFNKNVTRKGESIRSLFDADEMYGRWRPPIKTCLGTVIAKVARCSH